MTDDIRKEIAYYQALVRAKDPTTMEKRRLASTCPVCGERFIDGAHRRVVGLAAGVVATGGEPKVFVGETAPLKLVRPGAILPLSVCPDCEFYERKASATCPRCGSTADAVVVCIQVLHNDGEACGD